MENSLSNPNARPRIGRMMLFVDGENMVMRYQDMVKDGWIPRPDVTHFPDWFVWSDGCTSGTQNFEVFRGTYYTYVTGGTENIPLVENAIKQSQFAKGMYSLIPNYLSPIVFFKSSKQVKGKGVDIQMTVDILSQVYQNNIDAVYLISGDGDYKPLIEEVIRKGKLVYLAAFSKGLNPTLKNLVNDFYSLDGHFFPAGPPVKQPQK